MKIGDVVFLKSGSPPMTVCDVPSVGEMDRRIISVVWHHTGIAYRDGFPEICLTDKYTPVE